MIPTYNGAEELSTLIPVLHSQEKVREVEIIVVDSGSQDGSADIAEKLGAKVIRIPKEEFSHSYARNLGASHATGDYLLFMTQDALPNGNRWLAKMLQPILKGDAVAVSCRQIPKSDCDLFGRFAVLSHAQYMGITSKDRILSLPKVQNYETLRLNAQLEDVSCLIIRNIFNKYQYRGNYAEDLDLGLRLIRDNYKLALLSSVQVIHSHSRPPFYHLRRCIVDMKTLKNILPDIPMGHTSTAQTVANRIISAYSVLALFICEALNYIQFSSEQEDFLHWAGVTFRKYEAELARKPKIEVEKLVQTQIPYMDESTTGFVSQITEEYFGHYVFDTLIVAEQRYLLENALPQYFVDTCEEMNSKRKLEICDMLCKHFGQCSGNTMTGLLFSEEDSLLKQLTEKLCIGI